MELHWFSNSEFDVSPKVSFAKSSDAQVGFLNDLLSFYYIPIPIGVKYLFETSQLVIALFISPFDR